MFSFVNPVLGKITFLYKRVRLVLEKKEKMVSVFYHSKHARSLSLRFWNELYQIPLYSKNGVVLSNFSVLLGLSATALF